jgi:hypothetical protein
MLPASQNRYLKPSAQLHPYSVMRSVCISFHGGVKQAHKVRYSTQTTQQKQLNKADLIRSQLGIADVACRAVKVLGSSSWDILKPIHN